MTSEELKKLKKGDKVFLLLTDPIDSKDKMLREGVFLRCDENSVWYNYHNSDYYHAYCSEVYKTKKDAVLGYIEYNTKLILCCTNSISTCIDNIKRGNNVLEEL